MSDTQTGLTYKITTLQDIYNLPTRRQIETCLREIILIMLQTRSMNDHVVAQARDKGHVVPDIVVKWCETIDWIDDGKGETGATIVNDKGEVLFTHTNPK